MPKRNRETPLLTPAMKNARMALRRAITAYTRAHIDDSWMGSMPVEEHADIEHRFRYAPEKLMYAMDKFEFAVRAEAIRFMLDKDNKPDAKPLPENANCRYCNGNMHYLAEIDNGPCKCAPQPMSVWQHTNGKLYKVIALSNVGTLRAAHPIDVIYQTHMLDARDDGSPLLWTRPLTDWSRSFVRIGGN